MTVQLRDEHLRWSSGSPRFAFYGRPVAFSIAPEQSQLARAERFVTFCHGRRACLRSALRIDEVSPDMPGHYTLPKRAGPSNAV
jgi:hypothetical protein